MPCSRSLSSAEAGPRVHSLKSPSTTFGPVTRRSLTMPARRSACTRRSRIAVPKCTLKRWSGMAAEIEIHAHAARAARRSSRRGCSGSGGHREAAEHDVAELVVAQRARRRHHPAHAQRRAKLLGVAGMAGAGTNHFLQRDHVSADRLQHLRDALGPRAAVEPAAPVNVVRGDAEHREANDRSSDPRCIIPACHASDRNSS